jgi:hypothetical protein
MSGDITDFYVHTVQVETLQGSGANGPVYAAPATVSCYVDGSVQLVRSPNGEQAVSQTRVYCSTTDGGKFTPDSRVTVNGRKAQVITANSLDAPGLGLPEHTAVYLT